MFNYVLFILLTISTVTSAQNNSTKQKEHIIFPELFVIVYTLPVIYFNSNENPHKASLTVIVLFNIKSKPLRVNSVLFSIFIKETAVLVHLQSDFRQYWSSRR